MVTYYSGGIGQFLRIDDEGGEHGSGRNIGPEYADGEESENGFGEHHDGECRKRERIRKAPGLKLERLGKGAGESCTAAEETTEERTSNLLCIYGWHRSGVLSSLSKRRVSGWGIA